MSGEGTVGDAEPSSPAPQGNGEDRDQELAQIGIKLREANHLLDRIAAVNDEAREAARVASAAAVEARKSHQEAANSDAAARASAQNAAAAQEGVLAQVTSLNAIASDAQAKLQAISEAATQAAVTREKIAADQAVIAARSDHIQQAQIHADTVRANLDRALTTATQHSTEAEGHKGRAQQAVDSATELLSQLNVKKAAADTDAGAIAAARDSAEKIEADLQSLLKRALEAEKRVEDYQARIATFEARLDQLGDQCDVQLQKITDLLPGAASAGLAYAFDARRKTFLAPAQRWQALFILSIVCLVALAASGLYQAYKAEVPATYDGLWRLWLLRLPIGAAFVWLAMHASREAALASRLEEDYGYKAAVAASFVGFNEQMTMLSEKAKPESPLAKLCSDTLATIAAPPGRIYDRHKLTVNPLDKIRELLESAVARKLQPGTEKPPEA
jgi:hypothetical protein